MDREGIVEQGMDPVVVVRHWGTVNLPFDVTMVTKPRPGGKVMAASYQRHQCNAMEEQSIYNLDHPSRLSPT